MLLIFTLAFALFPFETKLNKVNSFTHPKPDRYAKENCWYKKDVITKRTYTHKARGVEIPLHDTPCDARFYSVVVAR